MKPCGYCGRDNEAGAAHCIECGTPFVGRSAQDPAAPSWNFHSPLTRALTSGLGSLLIGTGAVFLAGRIMGDIFELRHPENPSSPVISIGMFFPYTRLLLGAAIVAFILWVCRHRCERSHSMMTGIATSVVFLCITFLPMFVAQLMVFWWVLPVMFIGLGIGTSLGFYIGAALQFAVGAWLLGAFEMWRRKATPNQTLEATADPPSS